MKKLLLFLAVFQTLNTLQAQCGAPQSQIDIHGNNIRARILNGGDLFTDFTEAQFVPNPNPNSSYTKMISTTSSTNGESFKQCEDTFVNRGRNSAELPALIVLLLYFETKICNAELNFLS